jgi:NTP pyrophosphatase (non-canonical NTP hydrolase)
MNIPELQEQIHENAKAHGWWDRKDFNVAEQLCLIHSEVSEAMEADRAGDSGKFAEELADTVIRIFGLAERMNIDMEKEIIKKHETNVSRPFMHGGKKY